MVVKDLRVIEIKGQRVLTTKQIAEMYETTEEKIRWNFKYNRKKYEEGKHYILIQGDELRELKTECEFQTLFKQARCVCLWTEKGALLHAKSLNTDTAWEVYDYLVDFYFRIKEQPRQQAFQIVEEKGNLVVNVPENVKIQDALCEVRKYLTAIEVGLNEYSVYLNEEDYCRQKNNLVALSRKFEIKICDMLAMKPQMVQKL